MNIDNIIEQHHLLSYRVLVKKASFWAEGNIADAEDIVQEAFVRALLYKEAFEEGRSFTKWFNRILINAFKEWKNERRSHPDMEIFDEDIVELLLDNCSRQELIKDIEESINSGPHYENEEILRLYYICGFSLDDVVKITDASRRTVRDTLVAFQKTF